MKLRKAITIGFTMLFAFMLTATPVFATDVGNTTNTVTNEIIINTVDPIANTTDNTVTNTTDNTVVNNTVTTPTEVVTFQDLVDRIVFKLTELLEGMKAIAAPVLMILFTVSAITAVLGAMSAKGNIWKGFWAMVTVAVVYSVIVYSDVIVGLFSNWLIS